MATPKWFSKTESETAKSRKQEKRIAKDVGGNATIGSGSVFSENDIKNKFLDIEAKRTESKQFILKKETWDKAKRRTRGDKMTVMVIDIEPPTEAPLRLAVIEYDELLRLFNK